MNKVNTADLKVKKNCLLVFRNKKLNSFDGANGVISSFYDVGYYFDKIIYVAYDDSNEIVRSLWDGKENYENMVVYCPSQMEYTLKHFLNHICASEFDEFGILKADNFSAFMLYSDRENTLKIDEIKTILDAKYGVSYSKAYVKTVGATASEINDAILKAINAEPAKSDIVRKMINFNVSESYGDCTIEIVYSDEVPKTLFDKVYRTLISSLGDYVYSLDNFSLADRLFQLLKLRRMKISIAESFTGGGIGKKLVEISGASEVYFEGLNTYSNDAKMQRLGVKEYTLQRYGAVSEQTAYEMAEGLIKSGNCDVSIATTGIAGPKSDNTSKPVGLIYIAVGTREKISVYKFNLNGDRETVTNTAINLALFNTFKTLK